MKITEAEYRQLQAEIDKDAKAQTEAAAAKFEQERVQNRQALERVWAVVCRTSGEPTKAPATLFEPTSIRADRSTDGSNGSNGKQGFAMKEAIREFVRERGNGEVSQPTAYRYLVSRYLASIRHRDQQQVRGQITGILSKMTKGPNPELKFLRKDSGTGTNYYRATAKAAEYKPMAQNFPTEVRK